MCVVNCELELADALIAHGIWTAGSVPGVVGWTEDFERVIQALDKRINNIANTDRPVERYFPPILDRKILASTGYLSSFPELCGSVHSFRQDHSSHDELLRRVEAGEDWGECLAQTDVALTPAVCYPLYPTLSGSKIEGREVYSLKSFVFRHEPSTDPARLQAFRQRENVCIGDQATVLEWRSDWIQRASRFVADLQLPGTIEIASDPFFSRAGRLMRANQIAEEGKFEMVCPITSESNPTAIASFNVHQDKFSSVYDIRLDSGGLAHSGCIGFGLERCALALFSVHGMEQAEWPAAVRSALAL